MAHEHDVFFLAATMAVDTFNGNGGMEYTRKSETIDECNTDEYKVLQDHELCKMHSI